MPLNAAARLLIRPKTSYYTLTARAGGGVEKLNSGSFLVISSVDKYVAVASSEGGNTFRHGSKHDENARKWINSAATRTHLILLVLFYDMHL